MRLLIVSNRLPVTVAEENGALVFNASSGGLVSGLSAYLDVQPDIEHLWLGWPGSGSFSDENRLREELRARYRAVPVLLDDATADSFYNGFCNNTIWPLFHYFPSLTVYDEAMWEIYKRVNAVFAGAIAAELRPDDVLWLHDYHLMLVPGLVRKKAPGLPIGFFLHIPFPSYENFRLLPRGWGRELLHGLLEADLIGFHTPDYTQYFFRCVLRILGLNHNLGVIALGHRLAKAETFPMGIDFDKYYDAVDSREVKKETASFRRQVGDLRVVFSVDRQDYSKGILNRLEGYELFLKNNPAWRHKVVLFMIIVPSRTEVDQYQKAREVINQTIGRINGDFGDLHWTPVVFQYKAISFEQLAALYNVSDAGLVTPLRDGMNLVAKEYVASQHEKRGVLILSEMAGAAMELGEALLINPNHREEIADAIKTALEMPPSEQARRVEAMQVRLRKYDVKKWAGDFLEELERFREEASRYGTTPLEGLPLERLRDCFASARNRIVFLDYDGTLVPFARTPGEAAPGRKVIRLFRAFSEAPNVTPVLISGRNREDLDRWYGRFGVTLVAEHGVWMKEPGSDWRMPRILNNKWKPVIRRMLERYRDLLPGSFIEEKAYSLAWHFRNSDPSVSGPRVKEFVDDLVQYTARNEIEVLMGHSVAEVKCSGVNKGMTARALLAASDYDFIMAAGDDETDEALFQAMPPEAFSIKIGSKKSFADYSLSSSAELVALLEELFDVQKGIIDSVIGLFRRKPNGARR
ncbi:MAG: bifunctional alpha,alpha-trehalose-phosphate synthase (UDP-forming)/trehalose-phosphatase [Spirochaetales bacterium]|nr:bifunctional alpha,alpha-trehalose-phosphate synthase (UDP-forming)/trehalose-phosphatase [Spirochaetales bacterium]